MTTLDFPLPEAAAAAGLKWYRRSYLEAMTFRCPTEARYRWEHPELAPGEDAEFGALGHRTIRDYMGHLLANVLGSDPEWLLTEAAKCSDDPRFQADMMPLMRKLAHRMYLPETRVRGVEVGLGWEAIPGVGVSGEIDRLDQCRRPDELEIHDYKFGRAVLTPAQARASFQARVYSWLVLRNFADHFRVWFSFHYFRLDDTAAKDAYIRRRIDFTRDDLEELGGNVLGALQRTQELEAAGEYPERPGWPQCLDCPLLATCPKAGEYEKGIEDDPVEFAGRTLVVEQRLAKMKKAVKAHATKYGPIILPGGGGYELRAEPSQRFAFNKKLVGRETDEVGSATDGADEGD